MKITNYQELATTPAREHVLALLDAGLRAVDTETVLDDTVTVEGQMLRIADRIYSLPQSGRLLLITVGKCALGAARVLSSILGDHIAEGIILDTTEPETINSLRVYQGTHPFPSEQNRQATEDIVRLLRSATKDDMVLFVISGGGSTLLHLPDNLTSEEEGRILRALFEAGAPIQDINTVRKHISRARGGFLAEYAYPARSISLIFSDVPSNDPQFIASGPTVRDTTTIKDAQQVLARYRVWDRCGMTGCGLVETPKRQDYFDLAEHIILVSNETALEAMQQAAVDRGLKPVVCTSCLTGEAALVGQQTAEALHTTSPQSVLLYGGETTVSMDVPGIGGRNQELVLSALPHLQTGEIVASLATDGADNSDHAGALCDTITTDHARELGLDPRIFLANHDSYTFFKQTGDYLTTGPTGSNVADLLIALTL